jgi:hypothetical protein
MKLMLLGHLEMVLKFSFFVFFSRLYNGDNRHQRPHRRNNNCDNDNDVKFNEHDHGVNGR